MTSHWNRALVERRDPAPAVLVAFPYVKGFLKVRPHLCIRSWALDSGAFTAQASGQPVDLGALIECAREAMLTDPLLEDVFSLDVHGDWRMTLKNTQTMWKRGVPAIPCWHMNEPEDFLLAIARDFPKIAIGGVAASKFDERYRVIEQVFARVWPKRIHGFGTTDERVLMGVPFHSADASSWELGPMRFRNFKSLGGQARLRVACKDIDLGGEVDHYLEIERRVQARWRHAMERLR